MDQELLLEKRNAPNINAFILIRISSLPILLLSNFLCALQIVFEREKETWLTMSKNKSRSISTEQQLRSQIEGATNCKDRNLQFRRSQSVALRGIHFRKENGTIAYTGRIEASNEGRSIFVRGITGECSIPA